MHAVRTWKDPHVASSGVTPDEVHNIVFSKPPIGGRGYDEGEVDDFLDEVMTTLRAGERVDVDSARFHRPPIGKRGYDEAQVDAFLARLAGGGEWFPDPAPTPMKPPTPTTPPTDATPVGTEQPFVASRGWLSRLRHRC